MFNKKVVRCIVFGTMVVSTLFAAPVQTLSWDFEKTEADAATSFDDLTIRMDAQ